MIEIANVKLPLDAGLPGAESLVRDAAARVLGVGADDVAKVVLLRRSVDARKKSDVHFVATLGVALSDGRMEQEALKRGSRVRGATVKEHVAYRPLAIPDCAPALESGRTTRPVVVGSGPAGLFCALFLARAGLRPIVLERGDAVEKRVRAVETFAAGGAFDPASNVQFGEGGAGTFSDGKLTTNVKSPLAKHVVAWFLEAGAPAEIAWEAKPHIGTDELRGVVRRMREAIERAGGEVRFRTQLTDVELDERGHVVAALAMSMRASEGGTVERIPCERVVIACGHSARDTFEALLSSGFAMERKPFSVGVRIEHDQHAVNVSQYGDAAGHAALGPADYKLAVHLPSGRSVYTFCMCPGGQVVAAASEAGGVVVNGMSLHARDGENANSALLVGVGPDDFGEEGGVLAGVEFQRRIERAAYDAARKAGGSPYAAPAETVGEFLSSGAPEGKAADTSGKVSAAAFRGRAVAPTYPRGVVRCDLREVLPGFVADSIAEALPLLNRKLHGFAAPEAVMTGVETRSSSPVRIVRGGDLQALRADAAPEATIEGARRERPKGGTGLYPCGEGAGYAGGIMSAAIDGLKVAQAIAAELA